MRGWMWFGVISFGPGAAQGPVQVSAESLNDARGGTVSEPLEREEGP